MIKWILSITFLILPILLNGQEKNINKLDNQGRKTGKWIALDEKGNKKYEGFFLGGHPIDTLIRFYSNETPKALMIYDSTGIYVKAELYDENGRVRAKGNYVDKKKNGKWVFIGTKGNVLIETSYENDRLNGEGKRYFSNGNLMEKTNWVDNTLNGRQQVFNEDGIKTTEFFYRKGLLDGAYLIYYLEGDLAVKGRYENNLKEGDWEYFLQNGTLDYTLNYSKGKVTNEEILDQRQREIFDQYERNKDLLKDPTMYMSDPASYFRR